MRRPAGSHTDRMKHMEVFTGKGTAMTGDRFPSEIKTYTDRKSGLRIKQLTDRHVNFHMYFTDNSFDGDSGSIYFFSDRCNGRGIYNLFHMDLDTGVMTQVTDEPEGVWLSTATKTRDSRYLVYWSGCRLKVMDTVEKTVKTVYEDHDMLVQNFSVSSDRKRIGFIRNEDVGAGQDGGPNYSGFKDKMYAIKDSRISVVHMDGTGFHDVWRDTNWLSHFQFSPDDPSLAMFCHEGPWNCVNQRIWLINMDSGDVWPCFRQGEEDCVGHEFWTKDGMIVFDNRGAGHDGTISSDRTQVFTPPSPGSRQPYFGIADKTGQVQRTVPMPFYCNHYMASPVKDEFVGDGTDDIVLIRMGTDGKPCLRVLANHNTTWLYQHSHCHPTFSWDGRKILYAADTDEGHCNLFLIEDWEQE